MTATQPAPNAGAIEEKKKNLYLVPPSGMVQIDGYLTEVMAQEVIERMGQLSLIPKPIHLWINSKGGPHKAGLMVVKEMRKIQSAGLSIVGIASGNTHSTAFFILQNCFVRVADKHSLLSIHGPWMETIISSDDTKAEMHRKNDERYEALLRMKEETMKIYRARFNGNLSELDLLMRNGAVHDPEKMLSMGFLDFIT